MTSSMFPLDVPTLHLPVYINWPMKIKSSASIGFSKVHSAASVDFTRLDAQSQMQCYKYCLMFRQTLGRSNKFKSSFETSQQ